MSEPLEHQFGMVIFIRELPDGRYPTSAPIPIQHDPEDPFCYRCGQKKINAEGSVCPGRDEDDPSFNIPLKDYSI